MMLTVMVNLQACQRSSQIGYIAPGAQKTAPLPETLNTHADCDCVLESTTMQQLTMLQSRRHISEILTFLSKIADADLLLELCLLPLNGGLVDLEAVDAGHVLGRVLRGQALGIREEHEGREGRAEEGAVNVLVARPWHVHLLTPRTEQLYA